MVSYNQKLWTQEKLIESSMYSSYEINNINFKNLIFYPTLKSSYHLQYLPMKHWSDLLTEYERSMSSMTTCTYIQVKAH